MNGDFDLDEPTPGRRKRVSILRLKALADAARATDGQASTESFQAKAAAIQDIHEGPAATPPKAAALPAPPLAPALRLTRENLVLAIALGGVLENPRCRSRR